MPFLQEVSQACMEASLLDAKSNVRQVESFYRTSTLEETQLLAARHVPACLAAEVPHKALSSVGLSEAHNRLSPQTKWGVKEQLALSAHSNACAFLRMTNNFQLSLSAMESQLESCKLQVELLAAKSFQSEQEKEGVNEITDELIHKFNIMSLALTDMQHTNVDLLNTSAFQYGKSLKDRADAWIQATDLPKPVKQAVSKISMDTPTAGSSKPLQVISSEAQKVVTDFVTGRKERNERAALMKAIKPSPPPKPAQQKQQQQQSAFKSPLMQQFLNWQKSQSTWQPQRGGARGGRGGRGAARGKGRGFTQQQPFSKGQGRGQKQ